MILAPILATLAKKGLGLIGEAVIAKGKDWVEKKTGIELKEDMSSEDLMELEKFQISNATELEEIAQGNLTARHEADMKSDSWLSKNVRPMTLIAITTAIFIAVFIPDEYISADKYSHLVSLGKLVFAYYFLGRSAEKTNVMGFGKK